MHFRQPYAAFLVREFTKTFEKVPASRRRHGGKVYEYGYVWLLLPPDCVGKTAVVKVYVLEEGEMPPQPQPAQPAAPQPATPTRPQPRPQPAQPATPRPAQPALSRPLTQPRPQQAQLRPPAQPPAQPQAPLLPPHRILSEPLLRPSQPSLSPELASLLTLRPRPERFQLRDLMPFEEFTLGEEEKEEEKRKRGLFRWP